MTDSTKTTTSLPLGVPLQVAQDIGDRLRATREQLNLGVNQVSLRVRIRESYLESMESGRWHELPPGLNGRGLVRVYAKELGVTLPEMIPQEGLRQSHPQYVPSIEVSVVSRKDYEQRLRNSPPEKDQRSRFASAQQPIPPVRYSAPKAFATPRANSLPERRSYASTSATTPQNKNPLARMNEREDESLMDVVSPDVASILGIQPSDFNPLKKEKESKSVSPAQVDAETLVANLLNNDFGHSEPPQSQPISKMFGDETKSSISQEFSPDLDDEATVLTSHTSSKNQVNQKIHSQAPPNESRSFHEKTEVGQTQYATTEAGQTHYAKTEAGQTQNAQSEAVLASDAESQIVTTKADETIKSKTKAAAVAIPKGPSDSMWKYALGGIVFVVVALALVRTINAKNNPDRLVNSEANQSVDTPAEPTANESNPSENPNEVAGGKMERVLVPEATDSSKVTSQPGDSSKALNSQTIVETGDTPPVPAVAATTQSQQSPKSQQPSQPPESSQSQGASVASSTGLQPATGAVDSSKKGIETSLLGTGSVREATLKFMGTAEVQVTADGKKILDGIQEKGEFKFNFAKKVEIFVTDGSKVRLKYGGWDHGLLGHPGRKRRLILNAESYGDEPKAQQ